MRTVRLPSILSAVLAIALVVFGMASCKSSKNTKLPLPAVSGRAGEIVIVVDRTLWNSSLGAKFREILEVEYPFLPQPEPSFKLVSISEDMFSSSFKLHRNLIFVDISTEIEAAKMQVQYNTWAAPQIVIKISGPNVDAVVDLLDQNKATLYQRLERIELERSTQNARSYANPYFQRHIFEKYGINLSIPTGYDLKFDESDDFTWFEYSTNFATMGVFVYAYPYKDSTQLTEKAQIATRNAFLKKYVPSSKEGSYMTTTTYIEPEYTKLSINGMFLGRLRGLWEVEKGFMGGPFIAYSTIVGDRVVTVEGFVHAPKTDKRDYLRQMAGIVLTMIPEQQPAADSTAKEK